VLSGVVVVVLLVAVVAVVVVLVIVVGVQFNVTSNAAEHVTKKSSMITSVLSVKNS